MHAKASCSPAEVSVQTCLKRGLDLLVAVVAFFLRFSNLFFLKFLDVPAVESVSANKSSHVREMCSEMCVVYFVQMRCAA